MNQRGDKHDEEVCDVCGGRPAACRILGHRPENDRPEWRRSAPSAIGATPRTDTLDNRLEGDDRSDYLELLEHARQLERELAEEMRMHAEAMRLWKADLDAARSSTTSATEGITVPLELAEKTEAMFRSVDPRGVIAQRWTDALRNAHEKLWLCGYATDPE